MSEMLTLTELVNRGMLAIHERNSDRNLKPPSAKMPPQSGPTKAAHNEIHALSPKQSEEAARILKSAERLVQSIKAMHISPGDPVFLRRHVLRSVESFLADISSAR